MKNEARLLLNSIDNLKKYSGLLEGLAYDVYEEREDDLGDDIIRAYDRENLEDKPDDDSDELSLRYDKHYDSEYVTNKFYDTYFALNELDGILNKIIIQYSFGNPKDFKSSLSELEALMEEDIIFDSLLNNRIDPEHVIETAYSIFELTDFDTSFKNDISGIPEMIKDLSDEIIYKISQYPELLYNIHPRLFEELIFKILKKMKMAPVLTKQTRDGGADIIAFDDNIFTNNKYLIECKRYKTDNKVTVETVRGLYGVKCSEQASKAIIVTTSSYTKPAIEFANRHPWELELKDFSDIKKWLSKYWSH